MFFWGRKKIYYIISKLKVLTNCQKLIVRRDGDDKTRLLIMLAIGFNIGINISFWSEVEEKFGRSFLSSVRQSAKHFVSFRWSDKRSFSILSKTKSYLSEGLRAYFLYR